MQEFLKKLEKKQKRERLFERFEGWKKDHALVCISKNTSGITIMRVYISPQEKTEKILEGLHYIIRFSKRKNIIVLRNAFDKNREPIKIHIDEIFQVG